MSKRIIGIVLIVIAVGLMVFAVTQTTSTVKLIGFNQTEYTPPFAGHGPLVVAAGAVAVVLFLVGLYLVSPRRN